jgi:UDP-3-O-[3-hydroxymyristoyl] glucosamine N-acyltransferase
VEAPYLSFLKLVHYFEPNNELSGGIHPTAVIEKSAVISDNVSIGANCYVGENCVIQEGSQIFPNTTIQRNVRIGSNCKIYPNVSIYFNCEIGNNCIIHSGVVIGSDGFGFQEHNDGSFTKIPQIGNVIIGNDVEIGANTSIDRSFVGSTIIGNGVKLDNLIQIAHNDEIGDNTAMAAQVGISGSTKVGKRNRFGGQVGISGHIEIADDVVLLAKSGVASSVTKKGVYIGAPIRDKFTAFKIEAAIHNLPQLVRDIEKIKKKLEIE